MIKTWILKNQITCEASLRKVEHRVITYTDWLKQFAILPRLKINNYKCGFAVVLSNHSLAIQMSVNR